MPKVELPFEALLEATETLSVLQRDTLARHLGHVEEKLERAWTQRVDDILMEQITECVPLKGDMERLHELRALSNEGTLSAPEHTEYIRIADRVEQLGVQRLKMVIELARLRDVPPAQLLDDMKLFPSQ